jgi:Arc/MetJ-type ribon-helix-helix transcriptional regulator
MSEPTTIGLSESSHVKLKRLVGEGLFAEMRDAYRFALALALAKNIDPPEIEGNKQTFLNIGSLDPDGEIKSLISVLRKDEEGSVYRLAEKLADWGVHELTRQSDSGPLNFASIISESSYTILND